jgi:hypothetical protein
MNTTIVCPHCNTIVNVKDASVAHCDNCKRDDVTLYTCHVDGKTLTLCLDCFQHSQWKAGPSERKTAS